MEFLTLFFVIMTCLICAALAAASFGFRPTTFEQAVAGDSRGSSSRTQGSDQKKKKSKKQQTAKKSGSKNAGFDESDEDDSMPDEDVAVGLLHARGIGVKTSETTNNRSPRPGQKGQT